ncbi:MAG TPA: nitroreductase family protein [Acidimicrobiales bacterium]
MEFADVIRARRMVRAFERRPVPTEVLDRVLDLARQVPAAGNTQGLDLVVLEGPEQTARYWDATLPAERRAGFAWPGLLDAPVLIIPVGAPEAYVARYAEPDKARTGLGEGTGSWSVPYWYVDTAFAAMVALLAAVDEGLGALFFGQFEHEDAVKAALGIPADRRPVGTIALGYAAAEQRPSASSRRPRRPPDDVVHRGHW